ncbi:MAG TPA: nuclear transport factor 2 family protein [Mycobacterium sp.]|nr:nuclear transport factor 2 family protein [Mycobacterium sp.]
MTTSEIATVLAWHEALTTADLDTLVALSSDDIEVGDAHGAGQGHQALRQWATAAGITGGLGRMYVHDGIVVVELQPDDPAGGTGAVFRVVHDHVTAVFRHDDLAAALAATELTEADRVD